MLADAGRVEDPLVSRIAVAQCFVGPPKPLDEPVEIQPNPYELVKNFVSSCVVPISGFPGLVFHLIGLAAYPT